MGNGLYIEGSEYMAYKNLNISNKKYNYDLTGQALKFIDETCTNLRFDFNIEEKEKTEGLRGHQ